MTTRRQRESWGLLAGGLAVFGAVLGVVAWGRVRTVEVPRLSAWRSTSVTVCGDVPALLEAVGVWRRLGHPVVRGYGGRCDVEVLVDRSLEAHGVRHAWSTSTGVLVRAEVRVRDGADLLTLAHELGHALGYEHPPAAPTGHLMHPSSPGWDTRGLEAP